MSNKRKADEIETCNTWLTTRNKKQHLKEFESNHQRLSEQRIKLMKLSRRPVGVVTNTRQSKLPEFFKNPNPGKENKCTEQDSKVIQKSSKKIKGQLTTFNQISTNKKDKYFNSVNDKSSEESIQNSCTRNTDSCEINNREGSIHESLKLNEDFLLASIEGPTTVADRNKFADMQDYEDIYYKDDNKCRKCKNTLLDKFENDTQSTGNSSSSPCLDYSDGFFRNTPIHDYERRDSPEQFKESLDVTRKNGKVASIQVYEGKEQLQTGIEPSSSKYESPECVYSHLGNLRMTEQSDFSEVEQSGKYSLGNLSFSIDSEEHVLRLRESCTSVKAEHSEFQKMSTDSIILTAGESFTNKCDSEIKHLNKSNELYVKDQTDNFNRSGAKHSEFIENSVNLSITGESGINGNCERPSSNATKSSEIYYEDSQLDDNRSDCTFSDLELDSNGGLIDPLNTVEQFSLSSDSIDLVENSNGCLQIRSR